MTMQLLEALTILAAGNTGEINSAANDETRAIFNEARRAVAGVATQLVDARHLTSKPKDAGGTPTPPPWEVWMRSAKRDGVVQGLLMAKRLVAYDQRGEGRTGPLLDVISARIKAVEEGAVEIW